MIVDQRTSDIASAKRAVLLGRSEAQRQMLNAGCVLLVYSALEGGVKELCSAYLNEINKTEPQASELTSTYFWICYYKLYRLCDSVTDFERQIKIIDDVRSLGARPAKFPCSVETGSNLSPKIIGGICRQLQIRNFMDLDSEISVNILLRFRNNIAHGDRMMPIDLDRIGRFGRTAQHVLCEFAAGLNDAFLRRVWIR